MGKAIKGDIKFSPDDLSRLADVLRHYDMASVYFNNAGKFCIQGHIAGTSNISIVNSMNRGPSIAIKNERDIGLNDRVDSTQLNGERANDIFREGNKVLSGPFHVRCLNNHIFAGIDVFDGDDLKSLNQEHKVHIFTGDKPAMYLGSYELFIKKCYEITKRKVIIHVPAGENWYGFLSSWFTHDINTKLCQIVEERKAVWFKYDHKSYLQVALTVLHDYKATAIWDMFTNRWMKRIGGYI